MAPAMHTGGRSRAGLGLGLGIAAATVQGWSAADHQTSKSTTDQVCSS